MARPIVSIAMPVRNVAPYVRLAVSSIISQSFEDWEMFLIDDGSSDGTLDTIADLVTDQRIRVIHDGQGLGIAERLNQVLEVATGRFFARMDGDDVAYPERLELQLKFLESSPRIDLVGTHMLIIDQDGRAKGERRAPLSHDDLCRHVNAGFRLFHPTFFGRMGWFKQWRYRDSRCEDQDLLLRSYKYSHFANLNEILLAYRVAPHLDALRQLRQRWDYVEAVKRQEPTLTWLSSALTHGLRASVESIAVTCRIDSLVLRQRSAPTSQSEKVRWQALLGIDGEGGLIH